MYDLDVSLKQLKTCIVIASTIFVMAIILGYMMAIQNPQQISGFINESFEKFAGLRELNSFMIFLFIFLNNSIKSFIVIVFGIFFGIVPIIFLFINGQLIGFVMGISTYSDFGLGKFFAGVLPHGVLEIPAILLSSGYGIWLGYRFYRRVFHRNDFKIYFLIAMKIYTFLILPILLVAALIEAYLTPHVMTFF